VRVEGVDPRDTRWEQDRPVYRVYLWHQPAAPEGVAQEQVMWHCHEHRLSDAEDVHEVLAWIAATIRDDQTYTLYVEHRDRDGEPGLVMLAGTDPTEAGGATATVGVST
jgi:hypothetical protein